ncbi:MAG: sigma-54-dependent transcriptional regulator [Candidatus Binatia bacterium]
MTEPQETILVVDDDPYIQEALKDRLESLGYRVMQATDGNQALERIGQQTPQMAFLDIEMPGMKGMEVLKELRRQEKDFPVIMITAYGTIDIAVEAMKDGAADFVAKPFKGSHIAMVVRRTMEQQRLRRGIEVLTQEVDKRYQMVFGKSEKINQVINAAKKAAATRSTVLLLGESGVGKELFARAVHNWSERHDLPFVAINCVGLSKDLLESELFGYERGAFTGAQQRKKGKIELAHGGTVFLDEIGDITKEIQTKLLRFLQEREFERVGGTELISVDVRIIAATNRNLQAAVKNGRFREDLFYRINVVPITLPPLRERKEDIPELAEFFLRRFSLEAKKDFLRIADDAQAKLMAHDWPGNVRELANVIERAVVLGEPPAIQANDLPVEILAASRPITANAHLNYQETVDEYRREVIVKTLQQSNGNRTAAAKLLGLDRAYFQKLLKSFGINGII